MRVRIVAILSLVLAVVSTSGFAQSAWAQLANYNLDLSGSGVMSVSTYSAIQKGIEDGSLDISQYTITAKGRLEVKTAGTAPTQEFTGDLTIESRLVGDLNEGVYFETVTVTENKGTARERVGEVIRERLTESVRSRIE